MVPWFAGARIRSGTRTWLVPVLYLLLAVILGWVVPLVDQALGEMRVLFLFRQHSSTAASMLTAIATGMLTFTGLVFSLTLVAVQFSSSAYSPRLAGLFLEDRVFQHASGIFTATFVYSLIALSSLDQIGGPTFVSYTTLLSLIGVLVSVLFFLALVQRIAGLRIDRVLRRIAEIGRREIEENFPLLEAGDIEPDCSSRSEFQPGEKPLQIVVYSGQPAVVSEVDWRGLARLAQSFDVRLEVEQAVGDTVTSGATLVRVYGDRNIRPRMLEHAFLIGENRTIDQDPKYAIRLIVDIAIRALSPAINDPTTAVQCLDLLDDLLRRLAERRVETRCLYDEEAILRVVFPAADWDDYLALAIDEIRYYGATSIQVMRRLRALLVDLRAAVPEMRRPAVLHQLEHVERTIERTFIDTWDRAEAREADRQGLGVSREEVEEIG